MKIKYLIYTLSLLLTIPFMNSCSDSDQVVDQITSDVTRGAILRQVEVISNSVAINSATNELEDGELFSVVLEYQDTENGALLSQMDVYFSFADNTADEVENSVPEILVQSIPASEFGVSDNGLPIITYTATAQELQTELGLANDQIGFGGDQFIVRFEVILTDGRSFSSDDNSGTITGSFFNSPFMNSINVVCAPSMPTAGVWIFDTFDSFGDGWNGGSLELELDGVAASSIVNLDGPSEQTFEFTVPEGTQTISLIYLGGSFDEEVEFTVTSANGNVVVEAGPNPPVNTQLLDFCPDNL